MRCARSRVCTDGERSVRNRGENARALRHAIASAPHHFIGRPAVSYSGAPSTSVQNVLNLVSGATTSASPMC